MKSQKQTLTIAFGILIAIFVSFLSHPGMAQSAGSNGDKDDGVLVVSNGDGSGMTIVNGSGNYSRTKNGRTSMRREGRKRIVQ